MLKRSLFLAIIMIVFFIVLSSSVFALSSSSNTVFEGIDVSNWQGYINYQSVKEEGIDIVYIKSSQGSNITDPYFKVNYNNAKANNLKVGFYHYVLARNNDEAIKEAEYFSSVISRTFS